MIVPRGQHPVGLHPVGYLQDGNSREIFIGCSPGDDSSFAGIIDELHVQCAPGSKAELLAWSRITEPFREY